MDHQAGREFRQLEAHTALGTIRGDLQTSAVVRTLDDLNLVARKFVTLHSPEIVSGAWAVADGPLAIAKESVWFVQELSAPPRGKRAGLPQCVRAPLNLWVHDFRIQGFVHVPAGGTAMRRLDQSDHPFLALTSVSVASPDSHFTVPFLAVHRAHILGAQQLETGETAEPELAGEISSDTP